MKKIISFDIDGVIAESPYIHLKDRTVKSYLARKLFNEDVPFRLNKIIAQADVWLISKRKVLDGNVQVVTYKWLVNNGINILGLKGVICNLGTAQKGKLTELLGSAVHFDDDARVLDYVFAPCKGYLVNNPDFELNQTANYPRIHTWQEISKICSDIIKGE